MSEKAVVVVDVASAAAAFVSLTVTVTGRGGQWPAEDEALPFRQILKKATHSSVTRKQKCVV